MGKGPKIGSDAADFWDFLPPLFVKELRQGLRANQFVWPFIVVQIAALTSVSFEYAVRHVFEDHGFSVSAFFSQQLFHTLLWIVFCVVLPLTQFGALQPELARGRNVELLLLSNMTRWQIVLGKWFVGCVLSSLMLIALIPYWLVRYMIGNMGSILYEIYLILGIILANAVMNAIVVGASGFRNYVGRVFMIFVSAGFSFLTCAASVGGIVMSGLIRGSSSSSGVILFNVFTGLIGVSLTVVLNLQLGRARLRLFENPLDPPSTALVVVLIICSPILGFIVTAMTGSFLGWIMILILLVLALLIDPGPGRKDRRWAQA